MLQASLDVELLLMRQHQAPQLLYVIGGSFTCCES